MRRSTFPVHLGWLMVIIVTLPSLFLFISLPSIYGATIYKWKDKNGVVNFTDDPGKVPPKYSDQVLKEMGEDTSSGEPPSSVQSPSPSGQEVKGTGKDIYGMGETWWREKARPWNQQLKDATANLEAVDNKIIERSESTDQLYRSPTQRKMDMAELEKLKGESEISGSN